MENQDAEVAPTGKRRIKKLILLLLVLLLLAGGAGGGIYYWRSSRVEAADGEESGKKGKPGKSKKSKVAAGDEEGGPAEEAETSDEAASDEEVKTIVELPSFIINLADTEQARYLRMTVSLGIGGDEKSEKPDPVFSTKARNAILAVLTSKKSDEVLSAEGKAKLRKEILEAAQSVSEEPHVAAVYITEFIVQL